MMLRQNHYRRANRSGFTLMEIIVVVAIILILAGAGVVVYTTMLGDARESRAKMDVKSLETVVTSYNVKKGFYPQTLEQLTMRDEQGNPALLTEKALLDPWGQPYIYEPTNRHPQTDKPHIYSIGPPDRPKQISNWGGDSIQGGG